MTTQSISCGACGAAVPYGRLACPACGELLASVAGSGRRVIMGAGTAGLFDDAQTVEVPVASEPADAEAGDAAEADADAEAGFTTSATTDVDATPGLFDIESGPPIAAPVATSASPAPEFLPPVLTPVDLDAPPGPVEPAWRPAPEPTPTGTIDLGRPVADPWMATLQPVSTPGAYVPPPPAGSVAPARAWSSPPVAAAAVATAEGRQAAVLNPGMGLAVAPERVDEWARSLAVAGGAIATIGFVLPWATTVIGASGVGFFDRWGLAGPGHPLVVIGLLAIIALALLHNPIPMWLRVGVPAVVGGALVLGLAWPYLFSEVLGPTVGVFVVALGGALLIAGGVLALTGARHASPSQPV